MHVPGPEAPDCPFCGERWTPAMLALLDRFTHAAGCACCSAGSSRSVLPGLAESPTRDLCCDHCGKPIYRAPAQAQA